MFSFVETSAASGRRAVEDGSKKMFGLTLPGGGKYKIE
jgi:hypothetical protein